MKRNPAVLHIIRHQMRLNYMKWLTLLLLIFALLASPAVGQDIVTSICELPECATGTIGDDLLFQEPISCAASPPTYSCCAANSPECWACVADSERAYKEWLSCFSTAKFIEPTQEPSRDSQLLDFYRLRIANLERQVQVYEANDAEQQKIIASQKATIKALNDNASGKMSRGDWAKLGLAIAGPVISVIISAKGE